MNGIGVCLWFDSDGEDAAHFYVETFRACGRNAEIRTVARYPAGARGPEGKVMTVAFSLDGQDFLALNGGPMFKFSEAVSLVVSCEDQGEIDAFWSRLCEGGAESMCGWLKDRFGLSWQVVPKALERIVGASDARRSERVMAAVMGMRKFDLAALEAAAASV
jgi:predicted 3-demethylubiquinone-9 3-methyltransferase (glyoxalase superfamily)